MVVDIAPLPAEPPATALHAMIAGYRLSAAIYVVAELGIADLLADGPRTTDELAAETGTDAPSLARVLRALARVGVFAGDASGNWMLTPRAEALRSEVPGSLRPVSRLLGSAWSWESWADLLYSVRTGESAFQHRFGMDRFAHLAANPELNAIFNAAMTGITAAEVAAVAGHQFAGVDTLVDVGGGTGATLAAVLKANVGMRGVLFDQAHVVIGAESVLRAAGVADRCDIVAGSFFETIPRGGDAYLLKHIVHDWDDTDARSILTQCREAIGEQGLILMVEQVIDPGARGFDPLDFDLHMLVMLRGRERTEAEYGALLAAAGFQLKEVVATGAPVQVMVAEPVS